MDLYYKVGLYMIYSIAKSAYIWDCIAGSTYKKIAHIFLPAEMYHYTGTFTILSHLQEVAETLNSLPASPMRDRAFSSKFSNELSNTHLMNLSDFFRPGSKDHLSRMLVLMSNYTLYTFSNMTPTLCLTKALENLSTDIHHFLSWLLV